MRSSSCGGGCIGICINAQIIEPETIKDNAMPHTFDIFEVTPITPDLYRTQYINYSITNVEKTAKDFRKKIQKVLNYILVWEDTTQRLLNSISARDKCLNIRWIVSSKEAEKSLTKLMEDFIADDLCLITDRTTEFIN